MSYLLLAVSFALLLGGAVVFTNAVEWAGIRLGLGAGAVGSVLAATATALPESVIPIVAILSGDQSGQIAIGAILGAPFLLATLGMLVIGVSTHLFARRRDNDSTLAVHTPTTARDLIVFGVFIAVAGTLGLIGNQPVRIAAAVVFLVAYGVYVWRTVGHGGEQQEEPRALYFDSTKHDPPHNVTVVAQMLVGVAAIVGGAEVFVTQVEGIAHQVGISPLVLALVLAPLATELPEKTNSVLWTRHGKDALALGNVTGAMVFQSMVPVSVGLAFTPWSFTAPSTLAVGCALAGGGLALYAVLRRRRFTRFSMAAWGALYVGFVAYVGLAA
ncbi:sodium:calcium antiporter [Actinopolymorpha rutila]|uniref:Cation:H+ antiporter n=1 Tax=Actinopolymorpha rutila TaxID=446787 RepID=A0A852ZGD6_9ACTN|nr:sodium:calcium antiporter [Actinopolymorpha rutila]NYH90742.1 cation:H+ antiporter [Actinopolymorpha rutila]